MMTFVLPVVVAAPLGILAFGVVVAVLIIFGLGAQLVRWHNATAERARRKPW